MSEQDYEKRLADLEKAVAAKEGQPDAIMRDATSSNPHGIPDSDLTLNKYRPGTMLETPDTVRNSGAVISRDQISSFLNKLNADTVAQTQASIQRAISTSTGFTPYVLETPSIRIYPTEAPFAQMIPRVVGRGTDIEHWKSVLSLFYYSSINSGPFGQPGLGGSTDGQTSMNPFVYNIQSFQSTYQTIWQPQTQTFQSQWRSRALEGDLMARAKLDTLYALKLQEENWLINGASSLHAPPAPLLVASASSGNLATATIWVQVTAVSANGETTPSAIASVPVTGSTGSVAITFQGQPFATGYNVYIGAGSTQPTNSNMFICVAADFLSGALPTQPTDYVGNMSITTTLITKPTTGANPPATNGATVSTNLFNGAIALCYANPNSLSAPSVGEQGMSSVITQPAASSGLLALTDLFKLFRLMYGQARANPSHLFVSPIEGETLAQLIGNASNFRVMTAPRRGEVDNLVYGQAVGSILNPVTQSYVQVCTLPYLPQGQIMAGSFSVPFPLPSGVSDPPFRVMVNQDYTFVEYPPTIANPQQWGWAYLTDEVLVNQWQGGWGLLSGIVPPSVY